MRIMMETSFILTRFVRCGLYDRFFWTFLIESPPFDHPPLQSKGYVWVWRVRASQNEIFEFVKFTVEFYDKL